MFPLSKTQSKARRQEMLFQLVKDYAQRQGITERLKAENQMEWVGRMNCCKAQ
ncbi:MAG: TnpV protein [Oscillospiraceae bacterium]|nr:TnpV protein [Oscillospiraceae bacterium]MCI9547882.1 TnpV protein [Oscillospiraceae bacterium]